MTHTSRAARLAPVLLGVVLQAGCGNETSAPAPNQMPITEITGGPVQGARVPSRITFYFRGSDYDGTVQEFDWMLDTYPRSIASRDQITLHVPAADDPRWTRIRAAQVTLTAPADTLRDDPQAPSGNLEFDRWSTFYVRAIDNEGGIDASPEAVTFQAYTQAPVLQIRSPARAGETVTLPRTFVMNWDGYDASGSGDPDQKPSAVRWAFVQATLDGSGAPIGFPQALYDLPGTSWSDWLQWTAPDSSGRQRAVVNAVPIGPNVAGFVFAVQGRDDAGAITPQFERDDRARNNYVSILVDGALPVGPRVTVHALQDPQSSWTFDGTAAPPIDVSTALDTLTMLWDPPVASHYGALAKESRYGWNIFEPSNDNEWTAWSTSRFAGPHALGATAESFFLQCRDEIGQVTTGKITFHPAGQR